MNPKDFVHLHTHSNYSLLQGLSSIQDLIKNTKEQGMSALALTDYGAMYGAIHFYKECKKHDIKPIIGIEAYMAARGMEDKEHGIDNKRYLFTLLAKNNTGYQNLMKIVSKSFMRGFYYKPRVDKDLLREHHDGLICLSGPAYGELGQAVHTKNFERAKKIALEYQEIFGKDNYFIEIMRNGHIEGLDSINNDLVKIARELDVKIVATQNSHYMKPSDREAFDVLLTVGMVGVKKATGDFMQGEFDFKSAEQMAELFKDLPDAIENTKLIADICDIEIDLENWQFPDYPIPEGKTYDDVLRDLTYKGLEKREMDKDNKELIERIEYELDIIKMKGYSSYFLIVADLIRFCRENNIVSNTRGSAAGSIVAYLTFVTNVDPIELSLPFERFLNPDRPSLPDIDMDFADTRRDDVINYAREKYGEKAVAQIGTFGTMLARGSVRDTARALGYDYETGDKIAKLIPPPKQGFPVSIERGMEMEPDLAKLYKSDKDVKRIIDMAQQIEGCPRHISVHAAGVVISPTGRVDGFSPVQYDPKGEGKIITQYDMYTGDREGVVTLPKFDFLGIRNLSYLADCRRIVKKIHGIEIDFETLPRGDKATYQLLSEGKTMGIFQFSSSGMTRYLMELEPSSLEDLAAMSALYRPGPMQFIPDYIARKRNPKLAKYLDPRLRPILEATYGIIVYQEQIMEIANKLAGYTLAEGDKFRKAVGKKIPEAMRQQHKKFVDGCVSGGMTEKNAEELWDTIETFAAYGFNKAHSASYGQVAYWTAYMKAHYPVEYMTAILTAESGKTEKIAETIHECEKMEIEVLPPDINECFANFTVIETKTEERRGKIRFGLYTIKNFGHDIGEAIIEERKENGKFESMEDFLERVQHKNLNKKSLEALIQSGAMDEFGERGTFLSNMDQMLAFHKEASKVNQTQTSLFAGMEGAPKAQLRLEPVEDASTDQKLAWERELLGVYVSGHPLDQYKDRLEKAQFNIKKAQDTVREGVTIVIAGIVDECKEILTKKKQEKMAFIKISDLTGTMECVVFPGVYDLVKEHVEEDKVVMIKGKVNDRNGERSMIVEKIKELT